MKTKSILLILFFTTTAFLLIDSNRQISNVEFSIKELWSTENVFKIPESVIYDKEREMLYVSNINGDPLTRDNNGFISKLNLDGEIVELKWITGLNAPKGMGIYGDKLFVSDIYKVIEINILESKVVNEYDSDDAVFMNDVTVSNEGTVYISDNVADIIFKLENEKLDIFLSGDDINGPNGLFVEEDRLMIGNRGAILSYNFEKMKFENIAERQGGIDGLVTAGDKSYLVSNFLGAVHLIKPGENNYLIFDTFEYGINAADIEYVIDKELLLVPTFNDNRIFAYSLTMKK